MALYNLTLFRDGELVGRLARHCADDLDALDAARALCHDYAIEVYTGARLVDRVKHGDEPLNVRDAQSG